MKVRVKDTDQILEVLSVKLENGHYYSPDRIEIEKDLSNLIDHWQDVRERAAIAAMKRTMDMITHDYQSYHNIVMEGFSGKKKKTYPNEIAEFSVACADALIEKLKGDKSYENQN